MLARTPRSAASAPRYCFHSQTAMPKYGLPPSTVRCQPHERPDVALLESVRAHRLEAGFDDLADGIGKLAKSEHARGVEQPFDVVAQPEHAGAPRGRVAADPFEYRDAVVQGGREEVQRRFRVRNELAVQPDRLRLHW
jgi:hypothetical protein